MKLPSNKTKTKVSDFYSCERCKINTDTSGRMCPCPRGSCEAEIIGKLKITTIIEFTPIKTPTNG